MRSGTILWADLGQVWVGIWVDLGRVWVGSGTGSGGLGRDRAGSGEVWVGIWRGPAGGPNSVKNGSRSGSGSGVIWGSQKWSEELQNGHFLGSGGLGRDLANFSEKWKKWLFLKKTTLYGKSRMPSQKKKAFFLTPFLGGHFFGLFLLF